MSTLEKILTHNVPDEAIEETYDDDALEKLIGKVYNQQKIVNIYRRKKYGQMQRFAHTACTECGREKKVFLSNLLNDPDKYGSCVCSEENLESRIDTAQKLYKGQKRLPTNTSGYTGVSFVKSYRGQPYNKWRAYIEVDGVRHYLGDFSSKNKAIQARREAGNKGVRWYKDNKGKLLQAAKDKDVRKKSKVKEFDPGE